MKVLAYIDSRPRDWRHIASNWFIRRAQKDYSEPLKKATHVEHLLAGDRYSATIASSSLADGGVRIKTHVDLNPNHWIVIDAPSLDVEKSKAWFMEHQGLAYDFWGAPGSVFWWLADNENKYFCNESCGASVGQLDPHTMPPAGYCNWVLSLPGSRVVTEEFFA
jgi:hypothetical protein